MRAAALVLVALALTGCETTAERSARLEHAARRLAAGRRAASASTAFTRPSTVVKVLGASLLKSSEGDAAIVTLRNTSARSLQGIPIAITVADAAGRTVFQNNASGLEPALTALPSLPAHATVTWVDDQLPAAGAASVSARAGEARARASSLPGLPISGLHLIEDPTNGVGAAGTVTNGSPAIQRGLVVFVLATRGGATVAAGRAMLPELAAHASLPFTVFFIGDPRGARLRASAPATSSGRAQDS